MRARTSLVTVGVLVLGAFIAVAQPVKGPPPEADTAAASDADAGADPEENGAPAADDDLGAPPKPQPGDGGVRPAPLNPRANEFPDGGKALPPAEYERLVTDIAQLRARAAALSETLFKSKLRVTVLAEGDDVRLARLRVTVDDGVVYTAPERASFDRATTVYEHSVAPGQHVLGVEVERYDAARSEYRSWQSSRFSITVPEGKRLEAEVELEDDSAMGEFASDQEGEYDLRVRVSAQVVD